MIPDEGKALSIHRELGSDSRIVEHCEAVARVARVLAGELARKGVYVDEEAVVAGALLHDIGRTQTQTVRHGYEGAQIALRAGIDAAVVEMIKRHVGAGLSSDEAKSLGLPNGDYSPKTLEEKLVCFADKMVDANRVRPFSEEVKRFVRKGHDVRRLQELKMDVEAALGEDPESLVFEKTKELPG